MFTGSKVIYIQIDQQLLEHLSYTSIIKLSQMLTLLCSSNPLPIEIYWLFIASKQKRNLIKPHVLKQHNFHQLLARILEIFFFRLYIMKSFILFCKIMLQMFFGSIQKNRNEKYQRNGKF